MPFDGGVRYAIEIAAADRTAQAFASVDRRMKGLQADQRQMASAMGAMSAAGTAAVGRLKGLAVAYISVETALALFNKSMSAGDLGEQAEQIGVNTDQLQAYRLAGAQAGIASEQMDTAITKLARSMGDAAGGSKEAIERFDQLGVKLLDARGELRPVADVLPEVARGVLSIGSSSQRTATLMDLFGKSGAKMATVLEEAAKGNDHLIESGNRENAIISPGAIAAWDALGDRLTVTQQKWTTLVGEFGAPFALTGLEMLNGMLDGTKRELEQIQSIWRWMMGNMDAAKRASIQASVAGPAEADRKNLQDQLDALRQNPTQFGFKASEKALTDRLAAFEEATKKAQWLANQAVIEFDESLARGGAKLPEVRPPLGATGGGSAGASNPPVVKSGGGAQAAGAAAKKASDEIDKLGQFMRENERGAQIFIRNQEIERQALFMTGEAAMALRIEQDFLNEAARQGIVLSDAQRQTLSGLAEQMAASAESTRFLTDMVETGKDTLKGFFTDLKQGAMEGASAWKILETAGLNALDRLSSKALDAALFGGSGGGGGLFGGLLGGLFGGAGAGATSGGLLDGIFTSTMGSPFMFANGGQTPVGVPYLVGERGPEVRMDGRPGQIFNRGQWNAMGGRGGGEQAQRIELVLVDDLLDARIANGANVQITRREPGTVGRAVKQSTRLAPAAVARQPMEREGEWRLAGA